MSSERNADSRSKAQKVLQKSEQQGRNEYTIAYDGMNPFRYAFLQSFSSFQTDISSHPSHRHAQHHTLQLGLLRPEANLQRNSQPQVQLLRISLLHRLQGRPLLDVLYCECGRRVSRISHAGCGAVQVREKFSVW